MIVGGLDVGTTGCKLTLYSTDGNFVDSAYREYESIREDERQEIDARVIRDAVLAVLTECAGRHASIDGIGVTSFGESFVLLDEDDEPLLPIMLYTDPRGKEECRELCARLGEKRLTEITGVAPHAMYSLPKLLWVKKNRPDVYERVKRVLLIADYVSYLLTGVAQIDDSLATRTMAYDIRSRCFSTTVLDAAGVDPALFSRPARTGTPIARVRPEIARMLSLSTEPLVVTGCHDQIAAAVGAGALAAGEAVDGSGTVECITPIFDGIPTDEKYYGGGYSAVPFVTEGKYTCYAFSFTGGAALKWYRDRFAPALGADAYRILDEGVSDDPTGILVLPHFAGAATPYMDSGSRAAIVGLSLSHTALDLYRAIMEGVAYEMRLNLERLEENGIRPRLLYATGGGARSEKWLQIKADVLGIPLVAVDAKEVGAQGMCMLLSVALGAYPSLEAAKEAFVRTGKTYFPNEERRAIYDKYYAGYRELYRSVRPIVETVGG